MKNNRPKVSVIVPVYNVEEYIERCVRSLFEQTLDSIEYIFVNDCTPDNSMSILSKVLEEYPQRKEQVCIINHSQNLGAAKVREEGVKIATGEFIIHCDSDDWVDKEMYRLMYEKACCEDSDIVICDWYETDGIHHHPIKQNLDTNSDILRGLLNRSINGSLCNKLIACEIYNMIAIFPTAHMMEDVAYSIQFGLNRKRKISHIKEPLYYYYFNQSSICRRSDESSCLARCKQACENIDYIIRLLKCRGLEKKYQHELVVLKNSARVFLWPLYMKEPKRYYSIWRSTYPEINWIYPFTSCIRYQLRIIFFLANIGIYPYLLMLINLLRR